MFRGFTEQNHIGFTFQAQAFVTNLQEHSCGEEESSCNTHKRGKTDISVENCTKSICETICRQAIYALDMYGLYGVWFDV